MTKLLKPAVFLAGLVVPGWIGAGYLGTNPLAMAVVLLIAACYLAGGLELRRYQHATEALHGVVVATDGPVADLAAWLDRLPPSLRPGVRLRIEGERAPSPAPAITPYLVGLLVLLGMLGTLLGMMTTLRGTGIALESATDLDAVRTSLAAPVKGLAFAFGTSIAGVAASAMLGLLSALCRRERALAVHALDAVAATSLRGFSIAHQREEAFRLLQRQADAVPALVEQLKATVESMEQQARLTGEHQSSQQAAFFERAEAVHLRLAASVEASLRRSVEDGARAASATLQPVVESTMAALAQHAASLHERVGESMQRQVDDVTATLQSTTRDMAGLWTGAVDAQRVSNDALVAHLRTALEGVSATFERDAARLVDTVATRFDGASERASTAWTEALSRQVAAGETHAALHRQALHAAATDFGQQAASLVDAVQRSHAELQATLDAQTRDHARALLDEVGQLVRDAAEAPRAAAAVIGELRQNLSDSLARDNVMLEERGRLLATVDTLLGAVNHASAEQRAAVDALIGTSADALERVAMRFTAQVDAQAGRLDATADRIVAGAVEVASLGDVFGGAIERFSATNERMAARLEALESALAQSLARSDEQLAYYVAQAREVVDLSVLAQKQVIGELQQLARQRATAGTESA
ncbi:DUF802 domain-containing protein [Cognatilysobacter segetis]|uniref:DUF802 domain-containing protein n=1 Tax=Cognatilysobacter segetis TaxID=2492394 RepID=UPI00105CF562|nr:DUF802 domain-containing protein [Lysobacter segetis]